MKWFNRCKLDWLVARQGCLTATDVKELLPETKAGYKRKIGNEQYTKILSKKTMHLSEDDCMSFGAAARGHVLEPYAIKFFNENMDDAPTLYHWDDFVVTRKEHVPYGLAFSPDAFSIKQVQSDDCMGTVSGFDIVAEVKCYAPDKHMLCGSTAKENLDERWQLAVAMAVCEDIKTAYLIFYNPSLADQMYVVVYDRKDLEDEIETVLEVEKKWLEWIDKPSVEVNKTITGDATNEEEIIAEIMEKERLAPDCEKSVML